MNRILLSEDHWKRARKVDPPPRSQFVSLSGCFNPAADLSYSGSTRLIEAAACGRLSSESAGYLRLGVSFSMALLVDLFTSVDSAFDLYLN